MIPKNRLYAPGVAILNWFPAPNNASVANKGYNFSSQIPDSYPRREDLIRADYNLSSKLAPLRPLPAQLRFGDLRVRLLRARLRLPAGAHHRYAPRLQHGGQRQRGISARP